MRSNKRQLNIELLRIFSMLLINLWHVRIHGMELLNPYPTTITGSIMNYVSFLIPFHVDLFILITGYFGVRDCKSALIKNFLLIYFYSIGLGMVSWMVSGNCNFQNALMPISSQTWWFMTMYTVMLLIAPFIEKFVQDASRKTIYAIAAGALFVNLYLGYFRQVGLIHDEGYGMTNFICMYLLGVWIRKEGVCMVRKLPRARTWLVLSIICVMAIQYKAIAWVSWIGLTSYSSPYCIVMSMLVFLLFTNLPPPESLRKPILFFSSSAISVYLVTEYPAIIKIWELLFASAYLSCKTSYMEMLLVLFSTVIAFIIPCLIDKVRIPVTNYAKDRITKVLG